MQIKDSIGRFFELEYNIIHVLLTGWFLPMPPAMAALSALIVAENRKPKPERKHEMQYLYRPIPHSYSASVKKRLWYFGVLHGLYLPLGAKPPINSMQLFVIWDYWLVKKNYSTWFTQFLKNGNHWASNEQTDVRYCFSSSNKWQKKHLEINKGLWSVCLYFSNKSFNSCSVSTIYI